MQAAPSIAVKVFPLAGRPGPGLGASCLARQGTMGRGRRYLAFFLCRKRMSGMFFDFKRCGNLVP